MDKNIIINGDSIEEMKHLPTESVDLIFADPPYWMRTKGVLQRAEGGDFDGVDDEWDKFNSLEDYDEFTEKWLSECKRILKKNGSIWVIGGMQCIYTIGGIMQKLGYWIINDVIWHKTNPTPNFMGTRLNNSHETLIWATKSEKSKYTFNYKTAKELNTEQISLNEFEKGVRKQLGSVWRFSVCNGNERLKKDDGEKLHNTQKPEDLLYRIIAISSNVGDLILDPFGGTMTTGAIAKKMGREYIMIEREKEYCEYGQKRLDTIVPIIGDIENAVYDEKPIKVTMEEMINEKAFIEGETFYLKNTDVTAVLLSDGKLQYNNKIYDMHTLAAIAVNKKADILNVFYYWMEKRHDELSPIYKIREEYRNLKLRKLEKEEI
jgi:site-specific DNA-methyltransferase (adenine-specific)